MSRFRCKFTLGLRNSLGAALMATFVVAALSLSTASAAPPSKASPSHTQHDHDGLSLSQTDEPDPVSSGNDVAYHLTISRDDDDRMANPLHDDGVVLTDTLPMGSSFISAEPSQGTCSEDSGVVTCQLGDVDEGDEATVDLVVAAPAVEEATTIKNVARVCEDDDLRPDHDGATSTEKTTVLAPDQDLTVGFVPETGLVLNTDLGTGATEENPTTTQMTIPAGRSGVASIAEVEGDPSDCAAGYTCFGQRIDLAAPEAYGESLIRLVFTFDASALPPGTDLSEIQLFRDGVLVPMCHPHAYADPCVKRKRFVAGGDLRVTACSSETSGWRGGSLA
jgi:hypothetical protein